ncbi:hypothetical protein PYCC9005_004058 [Savitreella phatthalungensis]
MSKLLDLQHQMPFYGAYHTNKVNVLIHKIFVPTILFTSLVWLSNTGPLVSTSSGAWPSFLPESNAATLLTLVVLPMYIKMQAKAGLLLIPVLLGFCVAARHLTKTYAHANYYASIVHVVSWVMQFYGHGKHEGRKPALFDNLFQSFFLAPFFVWLEILFDLGFEPQLHRQLSKLTAERRIQEFKLSKQ